MQLTQEQLCDILMQNTDRITNGILAQRSLWVTARDRVMQLNDRSFTTTNSPLEKLKNSICLVFDSVVRIEEEHPRSLKKSKLELKALGFSNKQVNRLGEMAYQTTINDYYRDMFSKNKKIETIADQVRENYPGYHYFWNDNAFLGTGIVVLEHTEGGVLTGPITDEELKMKGWPTYNSAFKNEEQEKVMRSSLLSTIRDLLGEKDLTPNSKTQFTKRLEV